MKPTEVKISAYIDYKVDLTLKIMIKILNSKLVIKKEYQNIRTFLQTATLQLVRRFYN